MTDNHGYETPQKGATEWHESLNRNFRYIDRDIEIRDINAAKTDYRPKSGAKFLATDTEDVYVGDGDQWLRLATSGENPSFDTVAARTIVDRDSGSGYSVDQLAGGSGDGGAALPVDAVVTLEEGTPTGSRGDGAQIKQDEDAGAVIQAAADEVGTNGTILIEPGTFLCDTGVTLHESQWLKGAGMYQTELVCRSDPGQPLISSRDDNNSGRDERIRVSELTADVQNFGRWAINFFVGQDCIIERVFAKNAGDRGTSSPGGIGIRNQFGNDGTDHWIINCRAVNCSNVTIDCGAGGSTPERATVYGNKIFNPNGDNGQFTHGISVENINHAVVANNIAVETDGERNWNPALNVNVSSGSTVTGNVVRNVSNCLNIANGPARHTAVVGNTFSGFDRKAIRFNRSSEYGIENNLIANNVIYDGNRSDSSTISYGVDIEANVHAIVQGNVFSKMDRALNLNSSEVKEFQVDNNYFYNTGKILSDFSEASGDTVSFASFCGNYGDKDSGGLSLFGNNVMCVGNVLAGNPGKFNPGIRIGEPDVEGQFGLVANNVVKGGGDDDAFQGAALVMNAEGMVLGNVVWNDNMHINNDERIIAKNNYSYTGDEQMRVVEGFRDVQYNTSLSGPRQGSYSGDGTQGRFVCAAMTPDYVVVEDSSGTRYDVHAEFGTGYQFSAPSGELSITDAGFTIGDNAGDANPNTDGESYSFYAR